MVGQAEASGWDGAGGISKEEYAALRREFSSNHYEDTATREWLRKTHPNLATAFTNRLDYDGYTGLCTGGVRETADDLKAASATRMGALDRLPPLEQYDLDGLPKSLQPELSAGGMTAYKSGENRTRVKDGSCAVSTASAEASRRAQAEFVSKMNGVVRGDSVYGSGDTIKNPPTTLDAKQYFQAMADKGASPEQIKAEYGKYASTFYKSAGVDWKGKSGVGTDVGLDPDTLDEQFAQQPITADGKRLIDCEGFAVMGERVLGGLRKNGQPMFDVVHGGNASHTIAGVFPHGGDQRRGFIIDNDRVETPNAPGSDADWKKTNIASQRYRVLDTWMSAPPAPREGRGSVTYMADTYMEQQTTRDWLDKHR
jgi:hypothetical protein